MQFGPFPKRDLPAIEAVLKELNIPFTTAEHPELAAELAEMKKSGTESPIPTAEEPAIHYVEFEEEMLKKLGDRLEPYGITQQSLFEPDFDAVDYYCPKCGAHSVAPGVCKKDNVGLVTREEFKKVQNVEDEKQMQSTFKWLLIAGAIVLTVILARKFM